MQNNNKVSVFDTTLRDGQQSPGCGMSFEANIEYAHLANQLGIDVLEAGFPAASQLDFDIVKTIAQEMSAVKSAMRVAGLCQLRQAQVEKTMLALSPYIEQATVHIYLPVDPNLMQASLGDRADNKLALIDEVAAMVTLAYEAGFKVQFSPEGYSNMGNNFNFVSDVIRAVISSGGSVINCPDTIGGACEWQGENYIVSNMNKHAQLIAAEFPEHDVTWSIHCHNDFGLALVNSMNAVFKGPARQIEGCINGVGERAGNAALEQCIMYIKSFGSLANSTHPFYTGCDTKKLQTISNFVAKNMMMRQPNWPIVGLNAARHSSGGHTNAVLKNPLAYQPFIPEDVGAEISLIFGPLSGGNHAKSIIEAAGLNCDDADKAAIAQHIKDHFKDRRKGITDDEVIEGYVDYHAPIKVEHLSYSKQDEIISLSLTGLFFGEDNLSAMESGEDSAMTVLYKAILKKLPTITLLDYYASSDADNGVQANCRTQVKIKSANVGVVTGIATDRDIQISAMKALIHAVNQAYVREQMRK